MFELDDQRRDELVEQWAEKICAKGLGVPAIFLLEAHKPLAGIGSNVTVAFQPLLAPLVSLNVGELAAFMRNVDNVERLTQRIEELTRDAQQRRKALLQRRKQVRRRARRIARLRRQR